LEGIEASLLEGKRYKADMKTLDTRETCYVGERSRKAAATRSQSSLAALAAAEMQGSQPRRIKTKVSLRSACIQTWSHSSSSSIMGVLEKEVSYNGGVNEAQKVNVCNLRFAHVRQLVSFEYQPSFLT
jgi:hypothetical protein